MYFLKIAQKIDTFNESIGKLFSWVSLLLVLVVCGDVAFRYIFKRSSAFSAELEWHLFSILFLMTAGYTLRHDRHVRVDLLYNRFSPIGKAWINLLGTIFLLMPFVLVVLYTSIPYIQVAYVLQEGSPDPGGIPMRYLIKSVIVVGFTLIFIQGFSIICKALHEITKK